MSQCIVCKNTARNRYCSNICQAQYRYMVYITQWKQGQVSGVRGRVARGVSKHIRRYLLEKYNHACQVCKWNRINPTMRACPLEIDHIDGDAENNREENLRLLCPNCHSLTTTYKNLNRGNGRDWRRLKYLKKV